MREIDESTGTDRLRTWISGAARALDPLPVKRKTFASEQEGLAADWRSLGADLRAAMAPHAHRIGQRDRLKAG